MNAAQQALLIEIKAEKAKDKPDKDRLKKLAHELTSYDDWIWEARKYGHRGDPGGGSRSPSFGKWASDDERE